MTGALTHNAGRLRREYFGQENDRYASDGSQIAQMLHFLDENTQCNDSQKGRQ
jgi:hypothetical protein